MRIESLTIRNLRCFKHETLNFDPYTCLVGPNGAGKSTVLCALNIFFRQAENSPTDIATLGREDFHCQDTKEPIEITVTFRDLSKEAEEDFKGYVRQGKLIISAIATFDPNTGTAAVKQFGQRLGMEEFKPFFRAHGDGALAGDLKEIFESIEQKFPEIAQQKPKRTKDGMYEALRALENQRPDKCKPILSEDQFYGATRGANLLNKYVQWVFIPAVKNASEEQSESRTSALGKLLARTVRAKVNFSEAISTLTQNARAEYQKMLDENAAALKIVSESLRKRLVEWAHPEATLRLEWQNDAERAVRVDPPLAGVVAGEAGFEGELARLGHGFQRSYLLALLQELATVGDVKGPRLILGCEEPELYQHPPQARHLAEIFQKLSGENSQIIVTTHSPHFVAGRFFESVRLVRRDEGDNRATVRQYTFSKFSTRVAEVFEHQPKSDSAALAKIHQALQPVLNEMFFTDRLVLVEGFEDAAYIHTWLSLTDQWESFRRTKCHIVPCSGKNEMVRPGIIATGLEIPVFALADADSANTNRKQNEACNIALARIFGGIVDDPFPTAPQWNTNFVLWPFDLADTIERELVESLGAQGRQHFDDIKERARARCGHAERLEKNPIYIGHLLDIAWAEGARSKSLDRLCKSIIDFGAPDPKSRVDQRAEAIDGKPALIG
jgi:putative ATP-dependent endonuclease of the OLD family